MQEAIIPHSLNDIVAMMYKRMLMWKHQNRDIIVGLIGDRGGGKSLTGGMAVFLNYAVEGDIIRSNLSINADVLVDNSLAAQYGLEGGVVEFRGQDLNKHKFLTFDDEYYRNVFFIDEINVFLADARRAMATQNLLADDVGQQLRKLESPLFYTCINEMFVDNRIRDMTDIFIKCKDLSNTPWGIATAFPPGLRFQWTIYPMTDKITGWKYSETNRTINLEITARNYWGIIDTRQRQSRLKYNPGQEEEEAMAEREIDPIADKVEALVLANIEQLTVVERQRLFPDVNNKRLAMYGISFNSRAQAYTIADEPLSPLVLA